ncbi:host cell division inhibitory peptide Kil [Klebsiella oxytoca]|uniref:host cell division inhibitory peptide Kil n=2 Tax=Klebsiella TaxID=570 RepID=UPI0011E7D5C3|nr:host cell division inhibitory peptide Kil [Klebsiella grimontii]
MKANIMITPIEAAQSKFAIAVYLQDEVMFQQAIIQHAIATGKKVKNEYSVRTCNDCLFNYRRSTGSGNRCL